MQLESDHSYFPTKRTIFHTNSFPIHSGVRLSVLRKPCMLYHPEQYIKTVQVSGRFGKLRSTKSPPVEVRLNTGSGVKVGVPKTSDVIYQTSRSTYIQSSIKTTGMPCSLGNKHKNRGCNVRYNSRHRNK